MQFRAKQIAPPKDWSTFEDLCHALFKRLWKDPLAQKHGRKGQAQQGVDVFGSLNGDRRHWHGVQCKGKEGNYGSKARWSEVSDELSKAEAFRPYLTEWIFATSAPSDAKLQSEARELSTQRCASGAFPVHVLGWDEILALMAQAPEVVLEFYPEHADHLPQVVQALEELPSLHKELSATIDKLESALTNTTLRHAPSVWEMVTFGSSRGLGPALLGRQLGPSDASACATLPEVNAVASHLEIAYSARLVGEPGAGKSICSYQVAARLSQTGVEVYRLIAPEPSSVAFLESESVARTLYLIDDAHLLEPSILSRLENQTNSNVLLLSTFNAVDHTSYRGAIAIDAKRAVHVIAAAMREDLPRTLAAVQVADDHVGDRMMSTDVGDRLDHAEAVSDRPWQFCFVLGGGWRRSRQAADSARASSADLVLAAVAMRQLISRDARCADIDIMEICSVVSIDSNATLSALRWLLEQRLIISPSDCRTPHQRFASVVLHCILEGQNKEGREKISRMLDHVVKSWSYPYAGLRVLMHELRFGVNRNWTRIIPQEGIAAAVERCWKATGDGRGVAALAIAELWAFTDGGAKVVIRPNTATLSEWISDPTDSAFGFGYLLNSLAQQDTETSRDVILGAKSNSIAVAFSNAQPNNAYGLADLMRSIAYVGVESFNAEVRSLLDRSKLMALARHEDFRKEGYIFAKFCAAVAWWDEELALDMAEAFIPTAQEILARNAIEGFQALSHDLASSVLRVFDVLGVYTGKRKPTRRQWAIAREMCAKILPKKVAMDISSARPRHFQSAAFFLHFLHLAAPRKFDAVLREMDWDILGATIANDWEDMPHDTEVLLGTLYSGKSTRHLVNRFIASRIDQVVHFPPRLLLMNPELGVQHLAKGRELRLGQHMHVSWEMGGIALALVAEREPTLVEFAVKPFVEHVARGVTNYSLDSTGPAEGFIRTMIGHAPEAWSSVLEMLDVEAVEKNLAACLVQDEDHRRTAAAIVQSALRKPGPAGDMARRLRTRFPIASLAPTDDPRFHSKKRRRNKTRQRRASDERSA